MLLGVMGVREEVSYIEINYCATSNKRIKLNAYIKVVYVMVIQVFPKALPDQQSQKPTMDR